MAKKAKKKTSRKATKKASTNGSAKKKPLSVEFSPAKGGRVKIKGLQADEPLPRSLSKILVAYGFQEFITGQWTDVLRPTEGSYQLGLTDIARTVPVSLKTVSEEGKKGKVLFQACLGDLPYAEDKRPSTALSKAFKEWNAAGRVINETPLETALATVVEEINTARV